MVHEGKQPIFVYLCALLFEIEPATFVSQGNDLTEGHDGARRKQPIFVCLCAFCSK